MWTSFVLIEGGTFGSSDEVLNFNVLDSDHCNVDWLCRGRAVQPLPPGSWNGRSLMWAIERRLFLTDFYGLTAAATASAVLSAMATVVRVGFPAFGTANMALPATYTLSQRQSLANE